MIQQTESLFTAKGYFQRHFELCAKFTNQQSAFDAVEDELRILQIEKQLPVKARYNSYESFRKAKSLYYQNHRV